MSKKKKTMQNPQNQKEWQPETPPIDEKAENEAVQKPGPETTQESVDAPKGPETQNVEAEFSENIAESSKSDIKSDPVVETRSDFGLCRKCCSPRATPVGAPTTQDFRGIETITRQYVKCNDCGQVRVERTVKKKHVRRTKRR